jgi:hypothetical protein
MIDVLFVIAEQIVRDEPSLGMKGLELGTHARLRTAAAQPPDRAFAATIELTEQEDSNSCKG